MNQERREKAIAWIKEEIRSLERAPELNGCHMTPEWADQLEIMRTCLEAVQDHFPDLTKMVPLTLEQLRQMDGRPVWIVESPDWGHWELSEDAEDYICDRDSDLYGLTYPDPDGKAGLHKLGWVAYSYPPAHIDRDACNPCMMCKNPKSLNLSIDMNCRYCPKCGRPLTEEAWAELEKRMRGISNG